MATKSAFALVDYDSQLPATFASRNRPGRPPNAGDHSDVFDALLTALERHLAPELSFLEVTVRLYGGWTASADGERTDPAHVLARLITDRGRTRRKNVRLLFELAESMLALPHEPLYRTFREAPWTGQRLALDHLPAACVAATPQCASYEALKSWTQRGRCPNQPQCRVRAKDCAVQQGQKLVDTMIVSDAITAATETSRVIIVSKDDDIVPGVIAASSFSRSVSLIRFGRNNLPGDYDRLLQLQGIAIHDYPDIF